MPHHQSHLFQRFAGALRAWLITSVAVTVLVGIGAGTWLDYRREYRVHVDEVLASLEEQAHALSAARQRISGPEAFARHVDDFCAQMNDFISPGHHILVLDSAGGVVAHSRYHSGMEVEQALLAAGPQERLLEIPGHRVAQARLKGDDGTTIIMAQYLDHTEHVLRNQIISRGITAASTAAAIIVLLFLALHFWVLKPLNHLGVAGKAWAARRFSFRAAPSGPADLRKLASEFNKMAVELEDVERRRTQELEQARSIQNSLLPHELPSLPGLSVAAAYRPAEHVGGDLYDLWNLSEKSTAVVILDVGGHGISAALLTGVVKMALRRRLEERPDPAEALSAVNTDLRACDHLITACVGIWNAGDHTWTYASAGHPGGLLSCEGTVRTLDSTGPPLGILPEATWSQQMITLDVGSRLFLYTDGVVEAGVPHEPLGEEGLWHLLSQGLGADIGEQVATAIRAVVNRAGGKLWDDATLVGLEVVPG